MKKQTIIGFALVLSLALAVFLVPNRASASNAVIINQYVKHVENWSFSCRDTSKCSADSTNSSGMNSYTATAKTPYTFDGGMFNWILQYLEFSGNEVFTTAFGERYGITGSTYSGFFDEKTNKGSITRTATGPKGVSRTEEVFSPPPYFRTDVSDNVKGSDTSSSWTHSIDGISIDGKWESYSYSGDSKKYLIMNGPSDRTYTVTLSLGANTWRLNTARDQGDPDFNPRYFIGGDEIACRSIKVMGKKLDRNCTVKIPVSGGGVYDVTPVVNVPRYLYSQPYVLSIVDTTPTPTPTPTSRDSSRNSATSDPSLSSTPRPSEARNQSRPSLFSAIRNILFPPKSAGIIDVKDDTKKEIKSTPRISVTNISQEKVSNVKGNGGLVKVEYIKYSFTLKNLNTYPVYLSKIAREVLDVAASSKASINGVVLEVSGTNKNDSAAAYSVAPGTSRDFSYEFVMDYGNGSATKNNLIVNKIKYGVDNADLASNFVTPIPGKSSVSTSVSTATSTPPSNSISTTTPPITICRAGYICIPNDASPFCPSGSTCTPATISDCPDGYTCYLLSRNATTTIPTITLLSPNGGEVLSVGQTYSVRWSTSNLSPSANISLQLSYRTKGGITYEDGLDVNPITTNTGVFRWTVPTKYANMQPNFFKLRAILSGPDIPGTNPPQDYSNNYFTIVSSTTPPVPTISPTPSVTPSVTARAYLLDTFIDKAGAWDNFSTGNGYGNRNNYDWNIKLEITTNTPKTIKSITLKHLNGYEGWSTASQDVYGKKPYPLVVYQNNIRLTNNYDQSIFMNSKAVTYDLYAQVESEVFRGADIIIVFSDGSTRSVRIGSSSLKPALTTVAPVLPTVSPSVTPSTSPTPTPSTYSTPSPSSTPYDYSTPSPSPTTTSSPAPTSTVSPTSSPAPTSTVSPTSSTVESTSTPTPSPSSSSSSSPSPSSSPVSRSRNTNLIASVFYSIGDFLDSFSRK